MKDLPEIKILRDSNKSELKEKSSRFIALAFPVENDEEVHSILEKIKKEYYNASHYCYAYKFQNLFKYSDAGEPSGTAGIRILNAIEHFDLINILVVVVRYFGGTKLGVGGLGRAYYDSSFNVLKNSEIITKHLYQKILIKTDFQYKQKVYQLFKNYESKILRAEHFDKVHFECLVKPENIINLTEKIKEITSGDANVEPKETVYY